VTAQINRRQFLAGLAALGAAVTLPHRATAAQVDEAWAALVANPWFFAVNDSRTIVGPNEQGPKVNRDVYDIYTDELQSPDGLRDKVGEHGELGNLFNELAASELEVVQRKLNDVELTEPDRKQLQHLEAALLDPYGGWEAWVRIEGAAGLPRFRAEIAEWLAEDVDWSNSGYWPKGWSGQDQAMQFFQSMDADLADDLGVVVIEGEHPGSSYCAAQLCVPIADANRAAERLKLPFRFKMEGRA
jgi:hypothetical protein